MLSNYTFEGEMFLKSPCGIFADCGSLSAAAQKAFLCDKGAKLTSVFADKINTKEKYCPKTNIKLI